MHFILTQGKHISNLIQILLHDMCLYRSAMRALQLIRISILNTGVLCVQQGIYS